jgi:hypothetical protein
VQTDGLLENKRVFKTISGWPDGMKVDVRGNLYVTTNTPSLQIYSRYGEHLGSITIGARTTNCRFGGPDNRTLFVTSGTSVYQMHMKVQGSPAIPSPDFNGDGIVDSVDISIMVNHWHTDNKLYDIAPSPWGDGIVDVQDLVFLSEHLFEEVFDSTLVAHWALDETEGMTARDNANGIDDFVLGGALWQPEGGMSGGALELDGIDDCIISSTGINSAYRPFSVIAWIKGGIPGQAIISQPGGVNWLMIDSEGYLMTELKAIGRSAGPLFSETVITDKQWHRIGFVWDGSKRMLYVDGVSVAEDIQDSLGFFSSGLFIGVDKNYSPGTFFSGLIDDIRIYKRVVSP